MSRLQNARKVNIRLREKYSGLSEKTVQQAFDSSRQCQLLRAKFPNKPPLKPITAKHVQTRHQIDLVDMTGWKVTHGRSIYKYILTVQDVFSRYVWLKPLKGKSSRVIAQRLADIYMEHGPPKVLQHDQGCEFKGAVKRLMQTMRVKVIQSSPYHPQSQGKVERMHRALRKKLLYDLIHMKRQGVNWVSQLPKYAQVLNEDPKRPLGWMTPFEVYYGRKSNNILMDQGTQPSPHIVEGCTNNEDTVLPSKKQRNLFEKERKEKRRRAKNATKNCNERMVRRACNANPPSIYDVNDEVLVRIRCKTHRLTKKHTILNGVIMKRNLRLSKYKVKFSPPGKTDFTLKWFSVKDICSVTRDEERRRQKSIQRKYLIPYTREDRLESFRSSSFSIQLDPQPDSDCQFAALADQLMNFGIFQSATALRQEIVMDLHSNPQTTQGIHIANYVEGNWDAYLHSMSQQGTYGDHITLQRASELFNVQVLVISTLGPDATTLIAPSNIYDENLPLVVLGHIAEGQGDHYVSLHGPVSHYIESIQQAESERLHCHGGAPYADLSDAELSSPHQIELSSPHQDEVSSPHQVQLSSPHQVQLSSPVSLKSPVPTSSEAEPDASPTLPREIISVIIRCTLDLDMSMIGRFNRVSPLFRELTERHLPWIYIRPSLSDQLNIGQSHNADTDVSVMRLYRAAGRSSGLAQQIRDLFSKNNRWTRAWMTLTYLAYGRYKVKDFFWK